MLLPRYYFLLLGTERAGVTKRIDKHLLRRYTSRGSSRSQCNGVTPEQ